MGMGDGGTIHLAMADRTKTITAVRLHGRRDLRVDRIAHPGDPAPGQVRLRVSAVGICGSDLHTWSEGRIGDTAIASPVVLGHEFGGIIDAVGDGVQADGTGAALEVGQRVAVDPAQPCGRCELCRRGHPNLCKNLQFAGQWPTDGAMQQVMHVPASCCFAIPDAISDDDAALLETLGVALHAVNLAKIEPGESAVVLGAGPVGLCVAQVARFAGAAPLFITERLDHRLNIAERLGLQAVHVDREDAQHSIHVGTGGRGVDVAIECAWAGSAVQQAAEMLRPGGRLLLVGIPDDDQLTLTHSTARRKGLTITMVRRMKHTCPRAIDLAAGGRVDLRRLVSHRMPLAQAPVAFSMNHRYEDGVVKVILKP